MSQFAHLLHGEPEAGDFAYDAVFFCASWMTWTCFTLYGNVAADRTRTRILLAGMFGMAVMAAAVQGVRDGRHMPVGRRARPVLALGGRHRPLVTGAPAAVAAGLGAAVEYRHGELPPSVRRLLCAGFAVYVLIGAGGSTAAHATNWPGALRRLLIPSVARPQGRHKRRARASTTDA